MSNNLLSQALNLHFILNSDPTLIYHCLHVSSIANKIIGCLQKNNPALIINTNIVEIGSILHDIGRTRTHGIDHGVVGGQLVRKFGFSEEIALIAERHIGGGIPANEAANLRLPEKDYLPQTLEEKIVCYADKLVDYVFYKHRRINNENSWWCIKESKEFSNATNELEKLKKTLGKDHPAISRLINIENFLENVNGGNFVFEKKSFQY